ncbi:hypothetical protein [Mycolicibacterium chubuense]|uniref:hypothetical protein n=1 Tax=Mycolicibacterium chubuense TaxID=1800 RepID=UPI00030C8456|nr:hypothetical protein [Mycolicibacterium chubuense]
MTRSDRDGHRRHDRRDPSRVPWHNRTSTLLGASVAGLAVIAILIASGLWLTRQFNEPEQAPLNFVEPSFSATSTPSSTPTTAVTATSTSPPVTTDLDPTSTPPTTSTSASATPSDSATTSRPPSTQTPRTRETTEDDESTSTTRRRPRTNVTRTLYPVP